MSLQFQILMKPLKLKKNVIILNFWADWCEPCLQMNTVFDQLAAENKDLKFLKIAAESMPEISERFGVSSVPTFLFLKECKVIDKLEGANAPELTKKVTQHNKFNSPIVLPAEPTQEEINQRLNNLINTSAVMLFMKGTPAAPRCGFSSKAVNLLQKEGITFSSFDILTDNEVRNGLKKYSNWQTYPQLYIKGKLVGGLDIMQELQEQGELKSMIPPEVLK